VCSSYWLFYRLAIPASESQRAHEGRDSSNATNTYAKRARRTKKLRGPATRAVMNHDVRSARCPNVPTLIEGLDRMVSEKRKRAAIVRCKKNDLGCQVN